MAPSYSQAEFADVGSHSDDTDNEGPTSGPDLSYEGPGYWESNPEDYLFSEDDYMEKFADMSKALGKLDVDKSDFMRKFEAYLKPPSKDKNIEMESANFLYRMAKDRRAHTWLVSYLMERYPALLTECTESGDNALHFAIRKGRVGFVQSVLKSKFHQDILRDATASTFDRQNCIHQAIVKNLDPEHTVRLIQAASEETLKQRDRKGLTPLHHAVDYSRCTETRRPVIQALIDRGDGAFDQLSNPPESLSVYQHHIKTRKQHKDAQEEPREAGASGGPGKGVDRASKSASKSKGGAGVDPSTGSSTRRDGSTVRASDRTEPPATQVGANAANGYASNKGSHAEGADDRKQVNSDHVPRNLAAKMSRNGRSTPSGEEFSAPGLSRAPTAQPSVNLGGQSVEPKPMGDQGSTPLGAAGAPPNRLSETKRLPATNGNKGSQETKRKQSDQKPDLNMAEDVAKMLKSHYLRSVLGRPSRAIAPQNSRPGGSPQSPHTLPVPRTDVSAIRFLHGDNEKNKHVLFKFPLVRVEKAHETDFENFELSYRGLSLDEMLLSVNFGLINLPASGRRKIDRDPGRGRRDMIKFFDWLKDQKNVKYIIKVTVQDRQEVPHSDDAIIKALDNLNIEILDWQKIDLDPKTIQEACGKAGVRELHLWWGGNNAILRAWSEPDGIAKLSRLERVHIHQEMLGLESADQVTDNLTEFESRLESAREPGSKRIRVKIHPLNNDLKLSKSKQEHESKSALPQSANVEHEWLRIMDRFSDGIRNLGHLPTSSSNQDPMTFEAYVAQQLETKHRIMPAEFAKEVRVALIDDGVDFTHKALGNTVETGCSFDPGSGDPDNDGGSGLFHASESGHGTFMAYMIGRICPNVKIFVIRLHVHRTNKHGTKKSSFTAKSAADAVEFAVSRRFDIISMSWTIEANKSPENDNTADLKRLEIALQRAANQQKIVFCSAPDEGTQSNEQLKNLYPFGCSDMSDSIFRIGAAKADGSKYGMVGNEASVHFILPGHTVRFRDEDKTGERDDLPRTGSSVATAIAAGLAALIIHCVRLGAVYNWRDGSDQTANAVNKDTLAGIRQRKVMRNAFDRISNDSLIEVHDFFKEPSEVLTATYNPDTNGAKTKWNRVTKLARDLVLSGQESRE